MASVSDTEDDWSTLEELSASSDDEHIKQTSEQSTSDLQSKVDALQEKTDLLQLQIKLKDVSIKSLTDRLDALEAADHLHAQETRVDFSKVVEDIDCRIDDMQIDFDSRIGNLNFLQSQSTDSAGSMEALTKRVDVLATKVVQVEDAILNLKNAYDQDAKEYTDRMNVLESHLESRAKANDERVDWPMTEMNSKLDDARIDKKDLQSQFRLNKGFMRTLERRMGTLLIDMMNIEIGERENDERLSQECYCSESVHDAVRDLEKDFKDRFSRVTDLVKALEISIEEKSWEHTGQESNVNTRCERLEQQVKESFNRDISRLEKRIHDYIATVNCNLFKGEADCRKVLETDVKRVGCENKERMDNLERQNHALQNGLGQAQRIISELYNGIQNALGLSDANLSGLDQRVETLERSVRNTQSAYTIITPENRLRNWGARVDGLPHIGYVDPSNYYRGVNPYGTGHGVFVPTYVNGFVRR